MEGVCGISAKGLSHTVGLAPQERSGALKEIKEIESQREYQNVLKDVVKENKNAKKKIQQLNIKINNLVVSGLAIKRNEGKILHDKIEIYL